MPIQNGVPWTSGTADNLTVALRDSNAYQEDIELAYPDEYGSGGGGSTPYIGTDAWLKHVIGTEPALNLSSITRDANGLIATANVTWPDGTSGVWTTASASASGLLVYAVTYLGTTTKTVTTTVTRGGDGSATAIAWVVS